FDGGAKSFSRERLLKKIRFGGPDAAAKDFVVGVAGHEQHPDSGTELVQLVDHAAAAERRHLDVGENEIDLAHFFRGNAKGHGAVRRFEHAITRTGQNALSKLPERLLVVDKEDCLLPR